MNIGKTLFAQLMDFLPWKTFHRIVERYDGDRYMKSMTCADQFRVMAFAQLTYRESLRDIEVCLSAQSAKLYHMGLRQKTKRSTTIDLCLSLFPWALFRTTKSAVKMHTLLDLRGNIPSFIHISDGKLGDVNVLDVLETEPGAIYVMDRGYLDFARLYTMHRAPAFFVTRAKSNTRLKRVYSAVVDRSAGIICDQTVALTGTTSRKGYPEHLRRIRFNDPDTGKTLVFLTNNFAFPAATICALYKRRWQVELFFKWIKQHLRIKKFYGNSENAVKSQIWIAISVYVLVAIIKKRLNLGASLYTLLQIFSLTLFEKMPIQQAFAGSDYKSEHGEACNQMNLFAF